MTDQGTGLDDKPPHDPGSRTRRRWRSATERAGASRDRRGSSAGRLLPAREPDDPARRAGRCRARRRAGPVAVGAELKRRGELERVGGLPYLHTCLASVPTAANAAYYAEIVAAHAVRRRLVQAGQCIVQLAYDPTRDVDQLVDRVRGVADEMRLPVARGTGRRLRATLASTIVPRRIRWLWELRIILGGLTLLGRARGHRQVHRRHLARRRRHPGRPGRRTTRHAPSGHLRQQRGRPRLHHRAALEGGRRRSGPRRLRGRRHAWHRRRGARVRAGAASRRPPAGRPRHRAPGRPRRARRRDQHHRLEARRRPGPADASRPRSHRPRHRPRMRTWPRGSSAGSRSSENLPYRPRCTCTTRSGP